MSPVETDIVTAVQRPQDTEPSAARSRRLPVDRGSSRGENRGERTRKAHGLRKWRQYALPVLSEGEGEEKERGDEKGEKEKIGGETIAHYSAAALAFLAWAERRQRAVRGCKASQRGKWVSKQAHCFFFKDH